MWRIALTIIVLLMVPLHVEGKKDNTKDYFGIYIPSGSDETQSQKPAKVEAPTKKVTVPEAPPPADNQKHTVTSLPKGPGDDEPIEPQPPEPPPATVPSPEPDGSQSTGSWSIPPADTFSQSTTEPPSGKCEWTSSEITALLSKIRQELNRLSEEVKRVETEVERTEKANLSRAQCTEQITGLFSSVRPLRSEAERLLKEVREVRECAHQNVENMEYGPDLSGENFPVSAELTFLEVREKLNQITQEGEAQDLYVRVVSAKDEINKLDMTIKEAQMKCRYK